MAALVGLRACFSGIYIYINAYIFFSTIRLFITLCKPKLQQDILFHKLCAKLLEWQKHKNKGDWPPDLASKVTLQEG